MYCSHLKNIQELTQKIEDEITVNPQNIIERALESFRNRLLEYELRTEHIFTMSSLKNKVIVCERM